MTEVHEEQGSHRELLQVLYINNPKFMPGHLNQAKGLFIGRQKVIDQGAVSAKTIRSTHWFVDILYKQGFGSL